MGRIFVGLCQVGAWGCFDEFNRLEERMLSAVSQQVQYIQVALREHSNPNRDRSTYDKSWNEKLQNNPHECTDFNNFFCNFATLFTQVMYNFSRCACYYGAPEQAGEGEPRHGHLHHHEPWLRWSFQPSRQSEEAVPQLGHDEA